MDTQQPEYIPYGPEWEKELMKLPKKFLINMLRGALMDHHAIEDRFESLLKMLPDYESPNNPL